MGQKQKDKLLQDYFSKVKEHFGGDEIKTWDWFTDANSSFSGLSPIQMIEKGREKKVMEYIDNNLLKGN